jgi:hypothetical protein
MTPLAAITLVHLLRPPTGYERSLDAGAAQLMANLALTGHPVPADKRVEVRRAVGETTSYEEMADLVAAALAERFSVAELEELTRFYQSSIGRRALQIPEMLQASGVTLGQVIAKRVAPKLRQLGLSSP